MRMSKFMTLLVEDDALQRQVFADILATDGFEVVECATAESAELVIATSGTELRAVIADQNLQGPMLGSELAAFARKMFPRLTVVLMSGKALPRQAGKVHFLRKPFLPEELLAAVRGRPHVRC
jgi:DNA-binding NtrC family response regulator